MTAVVKDKPAEVSRTGSSLVFPGMKVLFICLICCFTAWGIAADLTTPMVAGFKRIFDMSTLQASMVQMAYYGAYFLLAIPAAFINQRFGYKVGLLTGLALAAIGAFAFLPASKMMTFGAFIVALFAMAAGCSILETSANPYVIALGPEATATRRLNLAQAFNPVGTNIGVLLASVFILPKLEDPANLASLNPEQIRELRANELAAVMGPYVGLAILLAIIWIAIFRQKSPEGLSGAGAANTATDAAADAPKVSIGKALFGNPRYVFGVIAQFFNIAAQVCTWTYIIQYVQQALNGSLTLGGNLLQASLILFLISRFVMTWVIGRVRATKVLTIMGAIAVLLCLVAVISPNWLGVIALVCVSACLSLMFPTIYGVALQGLGPATKFGAAGLVMAIVGGAVMPAVQGRMLDATSAATSFVVPALCFAIVTAYAIFDLRSPARHAPAAAAEDSAKEAQA